MASLSSKPEIKRHGMEEELMAAPRLENRGIDSQGNNRGNQIDGLFDVTTTEFSAEEPQAGRCRLDRRS